MPAVKFFARRISTKFARALLVPVYFWMAAKNLETAANQAAVFLSALVFDGPLSIY